MNYMDALHVAREVTRITREPHVIVRKRLPERDDDLSRDDYEVFGEDSPAWLEPANDYRHITTLYRVPRRISLSP